MDQGFQLTLQHILWRTEHLYAAQKIVSRMQEETQRYTYADFAVRVRRFTNYLQSFGVVGSLAWNTHRHLELFLANAIIGHVLHTINVRYSPSEIKFIVDEVGDRAIFYDSDQAEIANLVGQGKLSLTEFCDDFDKKLDTLPTQAELPHFDECQTAVICHTSGTTGHPKGVAYTHKSIFLHSLGLLSRDAVGISISDIVLPIVPMYHISAWDLPFSCLMTGANLVLPGINPRPDDIAKLIEKERVTIAIASPAVLINLVQTMSDANYDTSSLHLIVTGGSEPSVALVRKLREKFGIRTLHAWGMTETEAISTVNRTQTLENISRQGIPLPGIEVMIIDECDQALPWNGRDEGELLIRGAWVSPSYFGKDVSSNSAFSNGDKTWLRTGDIATIDENGYIKIVDRKKDLIRSGAEWISSIDLENAIMSHPEVLEAAVVGLPDELWGERPVAFISLKKSASAELCIEELRNFLTGQARFPNWWLPDTLEIVSAIPKTSTGKTDKKVLRKELLNKRR